MQQAVISFGGLTSSQKVGMKIGGDEGTKEQALNARVAQLPTVGGGGCSWLEGS
jgi:hypothetical protein